MTFTRWLSATGVMALSLTACWGSGVKPPDVKLNPAPKERYEITLTIDDPPEPIQKVTGSIQYNIKDTSCMPTADRIAGIQPKSSFEAPVDFKRTGDNAFVAYVYADGIIDEDYYGRGVCRWSTTGVISRIHVGEVYQTAVLYAEKIINEEHEVSFCHRSAAVPDLCLSPLEGMKGEELARRYTVTMKSMRAL